VLTSPAAEALQRFGIASGATIGLATTGAQSGTEPIEPAVASYATADDGARIYFEVFAPTRDSERRRRPQSQDVRPVLMVMGLGANGRLWAPAVRRTLAAGYPVITFDNRGCGRSSTPWHPWTTRTMAGDAVAVLDELGVEQAHVGAASLGGMIAQELALEFPERVSSLVLLATTGGFRRLDSASPEGLLHILEALLRSLRPGGDPERRVRDFLCMAASEDFAAQCRPGDETWETVAAMLEEPASQRGLALQLLAGMRHSTWSRLPQLSMPVQVHHGTEDPLVPLAAGRELARRIRGARFELHPGAGHGLFERTDEAGERILAFLAECEARSMCHVVPTS
jgi:pimeloyl-ACP methyl ester carboxylesterase